MGIKKIEPIAANSLTTDVKSIHCPPFLLHGAHQAPMWRESLVPWVIDFNDDSSKSKEYSPKKGFGSDLDKKIILGLNLFSKPFQMRHLELGTSQNPWKTAILSVILPDFDPML